MTISIWNRALKTWSCSLSSSKNSIRKQRQMKEAKHHCRRGGWCQQEASSSFFCCISWKMEHLQQLGWCSSEKQVAGYSLCCRGGGGDEVQQPPWKERWWRREMLWVLMVKDESICNGGHWAMVSFWRDNSKCCRFSVFSKLSFWKFWVQKSLRERVNWIPGFFWLTRKRNGRGVVGAKTNQFYEFASFSIYYHFSLNFLYLLIRMLKQPRIECECL